MADEEQFKMLMLFMREEMKEMREGVREDMRTLRSVVREEVNAATYASEQRLREEMKEVRNGAREDMRTLRSVVREEVNAAIYASEQRLREEIRTSVYNSEQRIGVRLTNIEASIAELKVRMDSFEAHLSSVETKVELTISILDDFSYSIKSLQESLRTLEDKVDDLHAIAMREIQKLNQMVATLQRQLTEAIANFDRRLTRHENTPIDQAHPRPHSAA